MKISVLALISCGAAWGLSMPFMKIAVSTGHGTFGLIFWQQVLITLILGSIVLLRGGRIPLTRKHLFFYCVIAAIGTVLPNIASYEAARHLPAGIISILLSTVPLFALPVALLLGNEKPEARRFVGLIIGFIAVLLIVGPEASLPDRALLAFIPIALIAPLFYGFEGNFVAKWGTAGLDPVTLLAGASSVGMIAAGLVALILGQHIAPAFGPAERGLIGSSVLHAGAYVGYVWIVGRAGSVFAAQVAYFVTGFGVLWSMVILGERFGWTVWLALLVMLLAVGLVQPRPSLAQTKKDAQT